MYWFNAYCNHCNHYWTPILPGIRLGRKELSQSEWNGQCNQFTKHIRHNRAHSQPEQITSGFEHSTIDQSTTSHKSEGVSIRPIQVWVLCENVSVVNYLPIIMKTAIMRLFTHHTNRDWYIRIARDNLGNEKLSSPCNSPPCLFFLSCWPTSKASCWKHSSTSCLPESVTLLLLSAWCFHLHPK